MAIQPTYPGVYVQEVPSGVQTITGVSTSVTLFMAQAIWGPANFPVLCLNYTDFDRNFTSDVSVSDLARAVRLFFLNGGTMCYVTRVARENDPTPANNAVAASLTIDDSTATSTLIVQADSPGLFGNTINVEIDYPPLPATTFNLTLSRTVINSSGASVITDSQTWSGLSMDPTQPRYAISYVSYQWATLVGPAVANTNRPVATATTPLANGTDGAALASTDYDNAYPIIDKEISVFNILVLPQNVSGVANTALWGNASIFCELKWAILLMDPINTWVTVQDATDPTTGVNSLRTGLVNDHSAIYFPQLTVLENGVSIQTGPSGAIAGLMARIDSSRGVWKAPAGTEATLQGISGLQYKFTDAENGVLNPRGINTLRIFPNGIVCWGARTMDGDDDFGSEYKYVPVRRTALYIEESLYDGLKWVVFEPNDAPLWAQIRLNVGSFMQDMFRQGAFQGATAQDAYFVKCDSETTIQNDIDLGIVNIWVGFAPLKPAEFVILNIQQMTGQIQV